MCGRLNVISAPLVAFIQDILQVDPTLGHLSTEEPSAEEPSAKEPAISGLTTEYNIAPTAQIPVIRATAGARTLATMRWWLVPSWAKAPSTQFSMFNARSETLSTSPAFRDVFKTRRCIIPVSGYFEWQTLDGQKQPYYVQAAESSGLALAGLWDLWSKAGQQILSCTIVTAAAPPSMQALHARIPVHLTQAEVDVWLDGSAHAQNLQGLLSPRVKVPLQLTPVSRYVNNARNKTALCLAPAGTGRTVVPG